MNILCEVFFPESANFAAVGEWLLNHISTELNSTRWHRVYSENAKQWIIQYLNFYLTRV